MSTTTLLDLAYQRLLSEQEVVLWQSERVGAALVEDELHSAAGTIGLVLVDNDEGDLVVGPVNNPPLR